MKKSVALNISEPLNFNFGFVFLNHLLLCFFRFWFTTICIL